MRAVVVGAFDDGRGCSRRANDREGSPGDGDDANLGDVGEEFRRERRRDGSYSLRRRAVDPHCRASAVRAAAAAIAIANAAFVGGRRTVAASKSRAPDLIAGGHADPARSRRAKRFQLVTVHPASRSGSDANRCVSSTHNTRAPLGVRPIGPASPASRSAATAPSSRTSLSSSAARAASAPRLSNRSITARSSAEARGPKPDADAAARDSMSPRVANVACSSRPAARQSKFVGAVNALDTADRTAARVRVVQRLRRRVSSDVALTHDRALERLDRRGDVLRGRSLDGFRRDAAPRAFRRRATTRGGGEFERRASQRSDGVARRPHRRARPQDVRHLTRGIRPGRRARRDGRERRHQITRRGHHLRRRLRAPLSRPPPRTRRESPPPRPSRSHHRRRRRRRRSRHRYRR